MIERHLMKLRARDEIDAEEEAAIRGAVAEPRTVPADRKIVRADVPEFDPAYLCLERRPR